MSKLRQLLLSKQNDPPSLGGARTGHFAASREAKAQLVSVQAVDRRIENLQEELAILQTARIAYGNALKQEL